MKESLKQKKKKAGDITILVDNPFYDQVRGSTPLDSSDPSALHGKRRPPPRFAGNNLEKLGKGPGITRRMKFKADDEDGAKLVLSKGSAFQNKENIKPDDSVNDFFVVGKNTTSILKNQSNEDVRTPVVEKSPHSSRQRSPFFEAILTKKNM